MHTATRHFNSELFLCLANVLTAQICKGWLQMEALGKDNEKIRRKNSFVQTLHDPRHIAHNTLVDFRESPFLQKVHFYYIE